MKKAISIFLTVVMMLSVMGVPAFAYEAYDNTFVYGSNSSYGMEYGNSGGTVGVIRKTDKYGKMIYVHGTPLNNNTFALVNAPAMNHTKTIGSVTFSNYIKHNQKTLNGRDDNGNRAKLNVTQVYVGIGSSMRSNVDRVEFMLSHSGVFNGFTTAVLPGYAATCDLAQVKTNTPAYVADNGTPFYKFLDYYSVRPYTNLGRNYDGTWQKGLTWVFEEHTKETEGGSGWGYLNDPNQYRKLYEIRVESPNGTEYYQVIVTNDTNYAGQKTETSKVESKPAATTQTGSPAKNATANPTTSPIYINNVKTNFEAYNINGNNYFKLRDVALALSGTDAQFNVTWDNDKQVINLISNQAYGKNGALAAGNGKVKAATLNSAPIMKDGAYVKMTAYNIEGNNFFKLRDLGTQFGFEVGWDAAANAVTVNTGK